MYSAHAPREESQFLTSTLVGMNLFLILKYNETVFGFVILSLERLVLPVGDNWRFRINLTESIALSCKEQQNGSD